MTIGVTGIFGSGKSTVLNYFQKEGAITVSADAIVHDLLRQKRIKEAVKSLFGKRVFNHGRIDRKVLGKIVFEDKRKRMQLEKIFHPLVLKRIEVERKKSGKDKIFVVEVPLLFESAISQAFEQVFDYIVCVSARMGVIKKRLEKKGISENEILKRWANQWALSEKEKRSDFIIDNDSSRAETKKQVCHLIKILKGEVENGRNKRNDG